MVVRRGEIEQAKANLLKSARAVVRLKYGLLADEELNERLPVLEAVFDKMVQRGELPDQASIIEVLKEVL